MEVHVVRRLRGVLVVKDQNHGGYPGKPFF